jgi:predicted RNA binding protein YcfA (HicA-like mRNA interferase family)
MPPLGPISRRELIRLLRALGFEGPFTGGRHAFMVKSDITLTLPNPHRSDINRGLLKRLLRQAGIATSDWDAL